MGAVTPSDVPYLLIPGVKIVPPTPPAPEGK